MWFVVQMCVCVAGSTDVWVCRLVVQMCWCVGVNINVCVCGWVDGNTVVWVCG